MALGLLRAYVSGDSIGGLGAACAPAPGGGYYLVDMGFSSTDIRFGRIGPTGTIAWQKTLAHPEAASIPATDGAFTLVSNDDDVALLFEYWDITESCYRLNVSLYSSAGTLLWQSVPPTSAAGRGPRRGCAVMNSSSDVFITGRSYAATDTLLAKLDGATGALSWCVNTRGASGTTSGVDYSGFLALLSGGDLIAALDGPIHTGSQRTYLQRISPSDGSVVWSKAVTWPISTDTGLAVDPSDNIYLWCAAVSGTNGPELPVMKVDSSGAQLWSCRVASPVSQGATPLGIYSKNGGGASSSGLFVTNRFGYAPSTSNKRNGFIFVPAAGAGSANAALTYLMKSGYDSNGGSDTYNGFVGGKFLAAHFFDSGTQEAYLCSDGGLSTADGTYGTWTRATTMFDTVTTATASVGTGTYTRGSSGSYSLGTAYTATESAGEYATELLSSDAEYIATGLPASGLWGTALASYGPGTATGLAPSDLWGAATSAYILPATGLAPSGAWGTAQLELGRTCQATGFSSSAWGEPWSERSGPPPPRFATGLPASTQWGVPVGNAAAAGAATGFSTNSWGAATGRLAQPATGLNSSAWGTPNALPVCPAEGWSSSSWGAATGALAGAATGWSSSTFGQAVAMSSRVCVATGFNSSAFGNNSSHYIVHARSGVFRASWGVPQAERTEP